MKKQLTTQRAAPATTTITSKQRARLANYDAITLEIERVDSLAGLLVERLMDLDEQPDAPSELYALSIIAAAVSDKVNIILENTRELYASIDPSATPNEAVKGTR
jgi:hypothetical protein